MHGEMSLLVNGTEHGPTFSISKRASRGWNYAPHPHTGGRDERLESFKLAEKTLAMEQPKEPEFDENIGRVRPRCPLGGCACR